MTINPSFRACGRTWHKMRVPKRSWDKWNPWRDDLVYVPLELLAHCASGGTIGHCDGNTYEHDATYIIGRWLNQTKLLDAYILPNPQADNVIGHSIGVRYGKKGYQYFSPYNSNPEFTNALLEAYRKD